MDEKEKKKLQDDLQDALNQAAAETLRADEASTVSVTEKERADKAEGELRALTTQFDSMKEERSDVDVDKLKRLLSASQTQVVAQRNRADAAEKPDTIRKLVKARVSLEAQAAMVLGAEIRLDEMSDRDVMVTVIERLDGAVDKDATEAYVSGCFTTLVKGHASGSAAIERVRDTIRRQDENKDNAETRTDSRSAREQFLARQMQAATPASNSEVK